MRNLAAAGVQVELLYLSVDPYMRGRMINQKVSPARLAPSARVRGHATHCLVVGQVDNRRPPPGAE